MSEGLAADNTTETLFTRVDELSTVLMVDGVDGLFPEHLDSLAAEAEDYGRLPIATLARELAAWMRSRTLDEGARQPLGDALQHIRMAIEQKEAAQVAMPLPLAVASTQAGEVETVAPPAAASAPRSSVEPEPAEPTAEETAAAELEASNAFSEDTELVSDFVMEAREHLALIEGQMLELEQDPGAMETLHSVFRTFHSIKGLAGFLEFHMIQEVAHEVETLLDLARNEKITVTSAVVDIVLESADYLKAELSRIESQVAGAAPRPPGPNKDLIRKINAVAKSGGLAPAPPVEAAPAAAAPPPVKVTPLVAPAAAPSASVAAASAVPVAAAAAAPAAPLATPAIAAAPKAAAVEQKPEAKTEAKEGKPAGKEGEGKSPDSSSVRVETAKLDHLLDMVGEMVIAQSLIRHNPVMAAAMDARLLADIAQLSRNTAEVQRTTMAMRMIPIGQLFQRTARLIRDLSRKAGKQIALETVGEDTEVDKTIAEELSDPLLHMVRNSVDHGIELPAERAATGKDPMAKIRLKAYHQAGLIVIEISDDGRGLNKEKIVAKALQNGVISSANQLSDPEIYQLIFEPGFSTAEKITDVSGRGVGMDVVKRNVQKLRGRIDTQSIAGQGTTFQLKFPLTLAIIEGLVVMVGNSRYIVPIFSVREMFRPTPEVLSTVQDRHEMALVRGNLLPIVRLHKRFNIPSKSVHPSDGLLVVAECDGKQFCLLVDDLVGKQEVVIKSLGETFKEVAGLAGCAILGDGRVGLILDMEGIYHGGNS